MQAFRIEWTEFERGWGPRPDGYSLHVTIEAAREYLVRKFNALPVQVPEEYSCPGNSWREPADAISVDIPESSILIDELSQKPSLRIFCSYADTPCGIRYKETRDLRVSGESIPVSYGEIGYSKTEQELLRLRAEISDSLERREISPVRAVEESKAVVRYLGWDL